MQDDSPELSRWFASRLDARWLIKRPTMPASEKVHRVQVTLDIYTYNNTTEEEIRGFVHEALDETVDGVVLVSIDKIKEKKS